MKKRLFYIFALLLTALLAYQLLFGRLFIFSPFAPGFEKREYEKYVLYFHENEDIKDYDIIDSLIRRAEISHGLHFRHKVKIFVCAYEGELKKFTGARARMITVIGNGRIFISEQANDERKTNAIHPDTYLLHELSHSLMHQNMSFFHALTYPQWFMEGLAVYTSDQFGKDGYLTMEETFAKMKEGYFVEPEDWGTFLSGKGKAVKDFKLKNKYRFIYAEYGSIVAFMIEKFGKDRFDRFLRESLKSNDFYVLFKDVFGQEFHEFINDFKNYAASAKVPVNNP